MLAVRHRSSAVVCHTLVLAGLLVLQGAVAGATPVHFHATVLTEDTAVPAVSDALDEAASFAAFVPLESVATLREAITVLEEQGEVFSPELAELSTDLGTALHAEGRYRQAIEAFDRSRQILRRNEGLYSSAEAVVLQAHIESLLALGDLDGADALQRTLLGIRQETQAQDALALSEAYLDWADWNLRYYLNVKQTPIPGGRSKDEEDALAARLGAAFRHYHMSLDLLADNPSPGLFDWKIAVERKIAALTLMANREYQRNMPTLLAKHGLRSRQAAARSNHPQLTSHGSSALQRAIDYSVASRDPEAVAERMLELGDWYLLLNRFDEAHSTYDQAARFMQEAGISQERQAAILQAGQPVHDPEAELRALARLQPLAGYDGYIDVAFQLDGSGKARNPRVLARSSSDASIERDLLRRIRADAFRPVVDGTDLQARQEVTLRYYFSR